MKEKQVNIIRTGREEEKTTTIATTTTTPTTTTTRERERERERERGNTKINIIRIHPYNKSWKGNKIDEKDMFRYPKNFKARSIINLRPSSKKITYKLK